MSAEGRVDEWNDGPSPTPPALLPDVPDAPAVPPEVEEPFSPGTTILESEGGLPRARLNRGVTEVVFLSVNSELIAATADGGGGASGSIGASSSSLESAGV